jgi:hypothetical protein
MTPSLAQSIFTAYGSTASIAFAHGVPVSVARQIRSGALHREATEGLNRGGVPRQARPEPTREQLRRRIAEASALKRSERD